MKSLDIVIEGELNAQSAVELRRNINEKLVGYISDHGILKSLVIDFNIRSYDYSSALQVFKVIEEYARVMRQNFKTNPLFLLNNISLDYFRKVKTDPHLEQNNIVGNPVKAIAEDVLSNDLNHPRVIPPIEIIDPAKKRTKQELEETKVIPGYSAAK